MRKKVLGSCVCLLIVIFTCDCFAMTKGCTPSDPKLKPIFEAISSAVKFTTNCSNTKTAFGIQAPPRSNINLMTIKNSKLMTTVPAIDSAIKEVFQILADIAVKKAKQQGMSMVKEKIEKAVCEFKLDSKKKPTFSNLSGIAVFPSTCKLVRTSSLDSLINRPANLRIALTGDVFDYFENETKDKISKYQLNKDQYDSLLLVLKTVKIYSMQKNPSLSSAQIQVLLKQLADENICKTLLSDHIPSKRLIAALAVAQAVLEIDSARDSCTTPDLIEFAIKKVGKISDDFVPDNASILEATRWADLAMLAITMDNSNGSKSDDKVLLDRLKVAVTLIFEVAEANADELNPDYREFITVLKRLTVAALDWEPTEIVQAAADGLAIAIAANCSSTDLKDGYCNENSLRKSTAFLKLVSQVGNSYQLSSEQQKDPNLAKTLYEQRKQYLEDFIDATTIRTNRSGDWVTSFGMNLGMLAVGYQHKNSVSQGENRNEPIYAQLALPVGFSLQHLPGSSQGYWPSHYMLTLFDIGQYTAWTKNSGITNQRWDSAISPGLQVGWLFGKPDNAISIGLQATYGPSLFAGDNDVHTSKAGAFRAGLFLEYYVPIFDFN